MGSCEIKCFWVPNPSDIILQLKWAFEFNLAHYLTNWVCLFSVYWNLITLDFLSQPRKGKERNICQFLFIYPMKSWVKLKKRIKSTLFYFWKHKCWSRANITLWLISSNQCYRTGTKWNLSILLEKVPKAKEKSIKHF